MPASLQPYADSLPAQDHRVGIIDIGSNSIRFVVYDQLKRAPVALYNEKMLCQLGKGLATSGKLNPEGVALAKDALRRFLALSRNMDVAAFHVMATAAVRDASDGAAFAQYLEDLYGIEIDIISGEREARLGALGICSSMHQPVGISGDLGGGSFELVRIHGMEQQEHATLPIGPLRLLDEMKGKRDDIRKAIEKQLKSVTWLKAEKTKHFYAIGGSLRAIARLHMDASGYPLHILHQYTVASKQFLPFLRELVAMPEDRLERLPGLPGKRVPTIPPAAMILEQVLEQTGAERIVFSASGIREGYLFEKLAPHAREQDVLLASCVELATKGRRPVTYASELMTWMEPLFTQESEDERRLRLVFCLLSEIAHHIHPEYRAQWAMQRIIQSSLTGITHKERVALALALYHRHQFKRREDIPEVQLISERAREWARLAGSCASLAYHLTGGIAGTLPSTALLVAKKAVQLKLNGATEALAGEAVRKRIVNVDEAYGKWVT